jgi:hypothetical protein
MLHLITKNNEDSSQSLYCTGRSQITAERGGRRD